MSISPTTTTTTTSTTSPSTSTTTSSSTAAAALFPPNESRLTNKVFLKLLEKSWKPFPPWCVSTKRVPEDFSEELNLFSNLLAPTSIETGAIEKLQSSIQDAINNANSTSTNNNGACRVALSGVSAAGFGLVEGPLFFCVSNTKDEETEESKQALVAALLATDLFEKPLVPGDAAAAEQQQQAIITKKVVPAVSIRAEQQGKSFSIRLREAPSLARVPRSVVVHFGSSAAHAQRMGELLKAGFGSTNARSSLAAWHVLMSSLKQTRNLDDSEPSALSSDAAATMMLSVANSYDAPPSCSQALTDFFLLYGFTTSFDMAAKSITIRGALVDVPKVHPADAISVIDPLATGDVERLNARDDQHRVANLAAGMTAASVSRLVNVFAYCYRVIAEYCRGVAEQERGRAESTLSTFLGGGPYWCRVVVLAEQGIEPYPEILLHTQNGTANNSPNNSNNNKSSGGSNNNTNNKTNNNNQYQQNRHNNNNTGAAAAVASQQQHQHSSNNNYYRGRGGCYHNNNYYRGGYQNQYQHQHQQQQQMILLPTPNSHQQPPTYDFSINASTK